MMWIKTNGPEVISETTGDETVVIHLGTGLYFSIKHAASELWPSLVQGVDRERLLAARNAKEPSQDLAEKITAFLEWLQSNELITQEAMAAAGEGGTPLVLQSGEFVFNAYDDMQDLLGLDPIHDADSEQGWPAPKAN